MADQTATYEKNIAEGLLRVRSLSNKLYGLSALRFIFFVLALTQPYVWYETSVLMAVAAFIIFIGLFLFLVKRYQVTSLKRKFEQLKIELNRQEVLAMQHRFDHFEDGKEFIDPHHINSYDLDLFGKGSLYQYVNRAVTPKGKVKLAQMFQEPMLDEPKLLRRQELIQELCKDLNWRQNFSAYGQLYGDDKTENEGFERWSNQKFKLRSERFFPVLIWVLPVLSITALLYWIFSGQSGWFIIASTFQIVVWGLEGGNIKIIYGQFGKRAQILQKYAVLLFEIESFPWKSAEGKDRLEQLIKNGIPSEQAQQLCRIISAFDNRNNLLLGLILNVIFLWDVWQSYRLVKWHRRNSTNYATWMEAIAFTDAGISLANFAYNNNHFVYPRFTNGEFQMEAKQMGHPLINPSKRINNNFELKGSQHTVIITGANMSGKSTFLRTIGVNMVLGMNGAPVCAKAFTFKPVEVFSNMRTTDSLFDDESYFFAELKRLQMILEEMDKGRELLIILDEILKGTNSVDKLYGSQKLLHRLIEQGTPAIIATHDLKLTEIERENPDKVKNQCFEIAIENDEMQFDYTLRNGVTTIMNASFLMKKMGIIR